MAAYVKLTNFAVKDGLLSGNPQKVVTGAELDDEFNAIAAASQINYTNVETAASNISVKYAFSTSTTMSDPGSGVLRFNNASPASVTAIAIDDNNSDAQDISTYIVSWDDSDSTNKGTLFLRQSSTVFAIYTITGLTDNSGWSELAVTYVTGSGSFVDGTVTYVQFNRIGDKGDTGPQGDQGIQGPQGDQGIQGPQGDPGTGDVVGPSSSTDGYLAVFDGTTGKLLKSGGAVPTSGISMGKAIAASIVFG